MKKKILLLVTIVFVIAIITTFLILDRHWHFFEQKVYSASDFGIHEIESTVDYNNNGIEDYHDIVLHARQYIESQPTYKSVYYIGGYPDDEYGVCTDVLWQALQGAGYSIKDLIDEDIKNNMEAYDTITVADPNIDFRRVINLNIYFKRHCEILTLDKSKIEKWQAGDIILSESHIMILSDKRNKNGLPFILHHDSYGARERNEINNHEIIGHYRFKLH